MLLCPPNLWQIEKQKPRYLKYIFGQVVTITLMVMQFIYLLLTFNNINELNEDYDFNNIKIYNILLFECYIPVLTYFILSLFCCQLCQVDKKLTGYRNRLIRQSFRLRIIIRVCFELIISLIVMLQFAEILRVDKQIQDQQVQKKFDAQIFIPCNVNLIVFLIIVAFDNSYYFIIVCLSNDFYWGCYYDEELPIISVVETQSFSFAKQSSGSNDQSTANFGIV